MEKLKIAAAGILFLVFANTIIAQNNKLLIDNKEISGAFPIVSGKMQASIYFDTADAKVVAIAAKAFQRDIKLITAKELPLIHNDETKNTIIIGTIGHAKLIDHLIQQQIISVADIENKWECFKIIALANKLIIVGSDRRGTAFGVFHLSKLLGVSPLVYWADVVPKRQAAIFVKGNYSSKTPSVQYRGIFINDEDWGLQPWAAKKMDTSIKDIGPNTYAKVFELLLRLKANYIWPAMHPCTKAFYYYKQNPQVANDYAIVVGGSHCEPMLRNNVCEWAETYEEEYKKKPGEWRYDLNKNEIYNYWNDRVAESKNFENIYTIGMRGVHDGSMPGPKDPKEKLKLLEQVITDQRQIISRNFSKPVSEVPQIFVPYKEVLSLYKMGLKLPEDVTVIFPDDNYGYIRQLPNDAEQKRSGGNGIYYHLSYWGSPADYLWLSSTSPALIGYEMKKAYNYNAKKLWVFNVGDIKPAELEIQFALDMAYDIKTYNEAHPNEYITNWAGEQFGNQLANDIAKVKAEYYALAAAAKPEHVDMVTFSKATMLNRIEAYKKLKFQVAKIEEKISPGLLDAYYELIKYPVNGALWMNEKIFYQDLARIEKNEGHNEEANNWLKKALLAFDSIQLSTAVYNKNIANGKWDGIMSCHPRNLKIFDPPVKFDSLQIKADNNSISNYEGLKLLKCITAKDLISQNKLTNCKLLPNLGICDTAITILDNQKEALINYSIELSKGDYIILVKCLPTFAMENEKQLNYAITINIETPQIINVHADAETKNWKQNVLQGFSFGATKFNLIKDGLTNISIKLLNKNLVISQIEIYQN